jgi:hypothetical protein
MDKMRLRITTVIAGTLVSLAAMNCTQQTVQKRRQPIEPMPAPRPAQDPVKQEEPKPVAPEVEVAFYQLVLLSEKAPAHAPPGMEYLRLQEASAREVGKIVQKLVIPSGPTGTASRYTLVYPSRLELEKAGEWAAYFDVERSGADDGVSEQAEERLRQAVAQIYQAEDVTDYRDSADLLEKSLRGLEQSLNNTSLHNTKRWAAGMLAAHITIHKKYDYQKAANIYDKLKTIITPGSYEQMLTWYAHGQVLISVDQKTRAKNMMANLITQFEQFKKTEVYRRGRQSLRSLEK